MSDPISIPAQSRRSQSIPSDRVRLRLTDIIAAAEHGTDTIITWYGKPIAVVISIEDYIALCDALENHRLPNGATQ